MDPLPYPLQYSKNTVLFLQICRLKRCGKIAFPYKLFNPKGNYKHQSGDQWNRLGAWSAWGALGVLGLLLGRLGSCWGAWGALGFQEKKRTAT